MLHVDIGKHRLWILQDGYITSELFILESVVHVHGHLASTPGRPLRERRPGINCLRMRRIFRVLSSKLDRKLNHPRRVSTTLRSKVNIYSIIIRRVYGEYTITRVLG